MRSQTPEQTHTPKEMRTICVNQQSVHQRFQAGAHLLPSSREHALTNLSHNLLEMGKLQRDRVQKGEMMMRLSQKHGQPRRKIFSLLSFVQPFSPKVPSDAGKAKTHAHRTQIHTATPNPCKVILSPPPSLPTDPHHTTIYHVGIGSTFSIPPQLGLVKPKSIKRKKSSN